MAKFVVETFYTCTFKITHKLDELSEKKLSDLENRNDGEVQIIDVRLNNRKTKTADSKKVLIILLINYKTKVPRLFLRLLAKKLLILINFKFQMNLATNT